MMKSKKLMGDNMDIEREIFSKTIVDFNKLIDYGFRQENDIYKYSKKFLNDNFQADIIIDKTGQVFGKVYDLEFNLEYTNIRILNNNLGFVNIVREEYKSILKDICEKCFEKEYFSSMQARRITKYIINKYGDKPEFLWEKFKDYGIFRNKNNNKWYAIIMKIDKSKISNESGEIEILDIKVSEDTLKALLKEKGFYEGYHMNKKNWLTIILDDTITDSQIFNLIDDSYNLINTNK